MLALWNLLFGANLNLRKRNSHSVLDPRSFEDVEQWFCHYGPEIPAQRKWSEQEYCNELFASFSGVILQLTWKPPTGTFTCFETIVCDFKQPYCSYFVPVKNQNEQQFILSWDGSFFHSQYVHSKVWLGR
jgi:hypothetical protein